MYSIYYTRKQKWLYDIINATAAFATKTAISDSDSYRKSSKYNNI